MGEAADLNWWVRVDGAVYGPFTEDKIAHYIVDGRVTPATCVSNREDGDWRDARNDPILADRFHRLRVDAQRECNFVIHLISDANRTRSFYEAVSRLGFATEIARDVFLLRTLLEFAKVKRELEFELGDDEQLIIVDSTHDRVSGVHLAPDAHARIDMVWNRPLRHARS